MDVHIWILTLDVFWIRGDDKVAEMLDEFG